MHFLSFVCWVRSCASVVCDTVQPITVRGGDGCVSVASSSSSSAGTPDKTTTTAATSATAAPTAAADGGGRPIVTPTHQLRYYICVRVWVQLLNAAAQIATTILIYYIYTMVITIRYIPAVRYIYYSLAVMCVRWRMFFFFCLILYSAPTMPFLFRFLFLEFPSTLKTLGPYRDDTNLCFLYENQYLLFLLKNLMYLNQNLYE